MLFIVHKWRLLVEVGDSQRLQSRLHVLAAAVSRQRGFRTLVVGFMDGTHQQIQRPFGELNQMVCWSGHKHGHCLKWQVLVLADGTIYHVWGGIEGRHNDKYMWKHSNVAEVLRRDFTVDGPNGERTAYQIYADKAYSDTSRTCPTTSAPPTCCAICITPARTPSCVAG
jgi:hypothetical protein